MQQQVKMVYSILAFHREPSAIVSMRTEPALHGFADLDVLLLNLIAEGHRLRRNRGTRITKPFEYRESLIVPQRNDDVRTHVVRVHVQHEIGKDPVIKRGAFPGYSHRRVLR